MTYRPNLLSPLATSSQAGLFKPDGVTISVAADATASVIGVATPALTDISSGALGGPALTDVDVLNRAGADYRTTQAARAMLFRRTPAGSRSALFSASITVAVLNSEDNDKIVVLTGGTAGALTADGSVADGFMCWVRNRTGYPLALTGITLVGGGSSLPDGVTCIVSLAGATLEAAPMAAARAATAAAAGTVKPDGVSTVVAQDGTLSVVTIATNALPAGSTVAATDLVATYSNAGSQDVSYSVGQISAFAVRDRAAMTDSRFYGIERIDLRTRYAAPLDGNFHPLSALGLAAAQAKYPNAGLTTGTDLSKVEQDTAAWLQAEYDGRTGSGAVIGLPDGANMMVSQQLNNQNASKVWFHGGRGTLLFAQKAVAAGLVPVRIANSPSASVSLRDLTVLAQAAGVGPSNSNGVAWTGYTAGSSMLQVDNCQGVIFERFSWNGFDKPFVWGDNTYGIHFKHSGGSGNNVGLNWNQMGSLNSMELITFERGSLSNNNYGFYIDASYGPDVSGKNQYAQGGSIFIQKSSIDYNNVRNGVFIGTPQSTASGINTYSGSSLHLIANHIETTCLCSGTASRILSNGDLSAVSNEFYENNNDGSKPVGVIEVAVGTSATAVSNTMTMDSNVPIFYSSVSGFKRVEAVGNRLHDSHARPIMLSDPDGILYQRSTSDGMGTLPALYNDGTGALLNSYGKVILLDYYAGPGTFTLPNRAEFPVQPGYIQPILNVGANTITIAAETGASLTSLQPGSPKKMAPGALVWALLNDTGQQWLISGQLTT